MTSKAIAIGLVGGIGCGKSTVARLFAELGYEHISADSIGHDLLQQENNRDAIANTLGQHLLTAGGNVDRGSLKSLIFSDRSAKEWLEALLHPQIHRMLRQRALQQPPTHRVIEISVCYDRTAFPFLDKLIYVSAPQAERIKRVTLRDGISSQLVHNIISMQPSLTQLRAMADDTIDNANAIEALVTQCHYLHHCYQHHQPSD